MVPCSLHAEIAAESQCTSCANPICAACTSHTFAGLMCPVCAARQGARRQRWIALVAAAFVGLVVGIPLGPLALVPALATFGLAYFWR